MGGFERIREELVSLFLSPRKKRMCAPTNFSPGIARGWRKLQQRMGTLKSIEPPVVSMPKISGHGIAATIPTCPRELLHRM